MADLTLFTDAQQHALHSLMDCIIPADDYPDGWQAGLGDYLVQQFVCDLAHSPKPVLQNGHQTCL